MASAALIAAAFLAVALISCGGASARPGSFFHPCNTLLISYTVAQSDAATSAGGGPFRSFAVYRIVRPFDTSASAAEIRRPIPIERPAAPHADPATGVVFIVMGLLFGAICGALAAATVYVAWSTASDGGYEEIDEDESDLEILKKVGFIPIPRKEGYEGN